jgi:glycosyltransferase involved in cell wall biosynthesis
MLSILIPVYNYNVVPLVLELHKQCLECEIDFEILVIDDGSNQFLSENQEINSFKNCRFQSLEKNIGRSAIRNLLAKKAEFDSLLFLDADTIPTYEYFIKNYIVQINEEDKIIYGGIQYQKEKPNKNQILRWVYGKQREALSVAIRNTNPNRNALTSNILIQKNVFISNKFDETINKYGYEDLVFLSDLKKKGVFVKHIDNPTYHLGLETSQQFLEKTKIALGNLKLIAETSSLDNSESKIMHTYILVKRLYLGFLISFLFKIAERKIERNLLSQNPSLLLFDFYKLGYYCRIKSK